MESIGERLKEFGLMHYGTLTEFAKDIKMSMSSLSMYINNRREPGTGILLRLENLGCSIDWLLTGKKKALVDVNLYPLYDGVDSKNLIEMIPYTHHKTDGMYCLIVNEKNYFSILKSLPYTILLVDTDKIIYVGNEVVLKDKSGEEHFGRVTSMTYGYVVLMPNPGLKDPVMLRMSDLQTMQRVVSKLVRFE